MGRLSVDRLDWMGRLGSIIIIIITAYVREIYMPLFVIVALARVRFGCVSQHISLLDFQQTVSLI